MASGANVRPNGRDVRDPGATWSAGSNGHVGTLELSVEGVPLDLEIYRTPDGQLLWLWRSGSSGRVCQRSAAIEGNN